MRKRPFLILVNLLAAGFAAETAWAQVPRPATATEKAPPPVKVNGVGFNEKGCQPRATLRTVAVPILPGDSVAVQLVVVRGRRPAGMRVFASCPDFNAFDLKTWLETPRQEVQGQAKPAAAGLLNYPPISGLRDGDRLCIMIGRLGKGRELTEVGSDIYWVYNVPLCEVP